MMYVQKRGESKGTGSNHCTYILEWVCLRGCGTVSRFGRLL
jgi:hypothetical protein